MQIDKINAKLILNDYISDIYDIYISKYIDILGITVDEFIQRLITDFEKLFTYKSLEYMNLDRLIIGNIYKYGDSDVIFLGCIQFSESELGKLQYLKVSEYYFPGKYLFYFKLKEDVYISLKINELFWIKDKNGNR